MMSFEIPKNVTWKSLKSGVVVLNMANGTYYTLNKTASDIWLAIRKGKRKDDILQEMMDSYDADEAQLKADVEEIFFYLTKEALIINNDSGGKEEK